MLKNLAKPSTMASEAPSSFHLFKLLSNTETYCPTIQYGKASFRRSHQCPRFCRRHLTAQESSVARYSPRIGLSASIISTNSDIDGTYCPTIQDGNPNSCESRHGPRICRRHVTIQESVLNALQPKFGHRPITAPRICLLSKSRSRATDVLFFTRNIEPHEYFLRYVYVGYRWGTVPVLELDEKNRTMLELDVFRPVRAPHQLGKELGFGLGLQVQQQGIQC